MFTPEWADKLYRGIKRNYASDFIFVCLTDEPASAFDEDVTSESFVLSRRDLQSCILEAFRLEGRVFFMGLDTVIVGDLADLFAYEGDLAMIRDPNRPAQPASGVMSWQSRFDVFDAFVGDRGQWDMGGFPADQDFIAQFNTEFICDFVPGQLVSYKVHVKRNRPCLEDARVVYFHGREKPHEIDEPFVREHWV